MVRVLPRGGARGRDGIFNGCSCGYNDKRREYVETTGSMYNNDDSLFTTRTEAKPTRALVVSLSIPDVLFFARNTESFNGSPTCAICPYPSICNT